jgi:Rieske 2Fe-2S family protein
LARFLKAAELGTGGATTLEGRFYTSSEIYREEQERIFLRHWICAGREAVIPQPGDYFVRELGTESVIVVRGRDGIVRAFHNVCRHRGTRICDAAPGRFNNAIRCLYHAWTYALDGRLLAAASMEDVVGFDPANYPLHSVALANWEGFLFVSLADAPEPFETSHAPLIRKFGRYNMAGLTRLRRIEYDVRANWKLIFENYSECYHCPAVHPTLVKLSPSDSGANDLTSGAFLGGYMSVRPGFDSLTLSGKACGIAVGNLPAEDLRRIYYYSIFPNMLLSLHRDYIMVHTLWPESPAHTRIECEWLFHPDASADPAFDPEDAVGFWDRTNREDWHICERSQLGIASRAYTPGPYSPREGVSAEFDRAYLQALGPESPLQVDDTAAILPTVRRA